MNNNDNLVSGIKKIILTVITQFIILMLSVVTGFIIPQQMSPGSFGYWQIYVFYLTYLNFFGLGFNDGVTLFYGGYDYKNLPFKKIRSAMTIIFLYLIIITIALFLANYFLFEGMRWLIYCMLILSIPITCLQCIILSTFLAVNKTGIYNVLNILAKVVSVAFYLLLIFFRNINAKNLIFADYISRVIIFIVCIILGWKIIFGEKESVKEGLKEFSQKARSGFKITIAIIASALIPVSGRIVIEWNESKSTYGIYSFAMSLLTIIMSFTLAAGYVIFPLLKKIEVDKLPNHYKKFSFMSDSIIYIALIAYIPLFYIINNFMYEYTDVLKYFFILLAMCVPLGRMQLLITQYYKAFRLENQIFVSNIIGMVAMIISTIATYSIFKSVTSVAICTLVVTSLWTYLTEIYLQNKIKIESVNKNALNQIIIMIIFIISGYFENPLIFGLVYIPSLMIYFLFNRGLLIIILKNFKKSK